MCSCLELVGYIIVLYITYKLVDYLIRIPYVVGRLERYILVTGCDTGFGHEVAKQLDLDGYNVFAGCLTEMGEEILQKQCSCRLKTIRLDVTNAESLKKAYQIVKESLPEDKGLWGLVNNAGVGGNLGPVEWMQPSDYEECFSVNLYGVINTTVTFLPLIKKEKGRVVNIASVFGRTVISGAAPYVISKYGVEAFSDILRRQLLDYGCSVHIIEPGFHKTDIISTARLRKALEGPWNRLSPELKEEFGEEFVEEVKEKEMNGFIQWISSSRISDVVDAYKHALLAMFPRARYVVGLDAKLLWLPCQMLPEWLGDLILVKLNKNRVRPRIIRKRQK